MSRSQIDLSTYIAIGDSITSGYADGALYYRGQLSSYPNLLAAQFRSFGGNGFRQALLDRDSEGIGFFGNSRLGLRKDPSANGSGAMQLCYLQPQGDTEALRSNCFPDNGPFHNLGIPGLKAITALMQGYGNPVNGEGNYNPFFSRQVSDPLTSSVLSEALSLRPSFFSLFIGNNDVLAYALSGGTADAITPASGPASELHFEKCIRIMVDQLTANGAKGVISGIPDISGVPYFNTIPFNGLWLNTEAAAALNNVHKELYFEKGLQPFVIQGTANEGEEIRFAKKGELILMDLLLDPEAKKYLQGQVPVPKRYVLTEEEAAMIRSAISGYNQVLRSVAGEKKLAFVDTDALIRQPRADRRYDPVHMGIQFRKNHVFSLDGIHLTPLGQALLANEFIKAINKTYGTFIPRISLARYRKMSYIG